MSVLPISCILPTRNRPHLLARLLSNLRAQDAQPAEIVVCDASSDDATHDLVAAATRYLRAEERGAAPQRNQNIGPDYD